MAASTFEEAAPDLVDLQAHKYVGAGGLVSHYQRNRGLLVIPVMGPVGTPPVVVRVHAPFGTRDVNFGYAKRDAPPLMPAPSDTYTGDVILVENLTFSAPSPDPNGRLIFTVQGSYSYVQPGDGRSTEDTFPIDAHPFPTGVDALGEKNFTPSLGIDQVLEGCWNQNYVDARILSSYRIIG